MRSDVVEVRAERVETALLSRAISSWRDGGLGFERLVHTFVPPVLMRTGWLDEIGQDAEFDPPDGEGTEAGQGKG